MLFQEIQQVGPIQQLEGLAARKIEGCLPVSRNGTSITHALPDALAAAELPKLRWHDLRAIFGGLLIQQEVGIQVVSRMLGHSSIGVTARHYAKVSDEVSRKASDRLAASLARSS